ncbi:MAG: phosphatidylserine decarboxylase [Verrucomicrobiales bacterium]|jgi:phosphatidylserine decarboxylase
MPETRPIQYRNRATGELETEEIYGEGFLRFIYENPLGTIALAAVVKRAWFSHYYGHRMDQPKSREKVLPFIEEFSVDPDEFIDAPEDFKTFNEFFYRKLKPGARSIAAGEQVATFPADGRHLGIQDLSQVDGIFAKGQALQLGELLGDAELAKRYADGTAIISRLCPVDYHRFHFPVAGTAGESRIINGHLISVNPIALRQNIDILWRNKRTLTEIKSPQFGDVLMLEVGATCVGGTVQTYEAGAEIEKGDEKGYFKFGGSMTITLFKKGRAALPEDLAKTTAEQIELYAKMGESMAISPPKM